MSVRYRNQPLPVAPGRAPPEAVEYHLLPKGIKAISKARKFTPQNGSVFTPSSNTTRIPLNSTGFLDGQHSYLSFKVKFLATVTANGNPAASGLDGTAQSFINQIRIEGSDGSELERISNYNVLVNALEDLQVGNDHQQTISNITEGANGVRTNVSSNSYPHNQERVFNLKLVTAFLNNEKYLPLNFIAGGGIVLEITWAASPAECMYVLDADTPNYSISEVAYVGQVIEMNSEFNESFRALLETSGGIDFHGATYREHTYAYQSSSNARISIPVAERAKSIKSMFLIQRIASDANNQFIGSGLAMSRRTINNLNSWQTKWGGAVYPASQVNIDPNNPGESLSELVKSITSLGNIQQGSAMNANNYTNNYLAGTPDVNVCLGFIGLDVEAFANASSVTDVGIDSASLALPISWELQFGNMATVDANGNPGSSGATIVCNTYCLCDVIFTLDRQGLLSVSI